VTRLDEFIGGGGWRKLLREELGELVLLPLSSIDDREHAASNGEEHSYEIVAIRKEKEAGAH
jgi:hypothetical protein